VGGGRRLLATLTAVLFAVMSVGACGGGSGDDESGAGADNGDSTTTTSADDSDDGGGGDDSSTTLPPGATAGLDDYDGDGELDPTCGTKDFGGGLVLRVPCKAQTPNEPPEGVTLVEGSLFGFNGSTDIDLSGISGSLILSRDAAGLEVVIVTFNTDNLFEVSSANINSPDTMDNTIKLINKRWPGSKILVRGHTDGTGGATANQTLSDKRAASAKKYLEEHGLQAKEVTAVGLGATQPLAKEDSDAARQFNRRVEIVVLAP
jgi:outer membrane protein OmpA-like peptidoglycan-associated protein